jgi:hypothetical protein
VSPSFSANGINELLTNSSRAWGNFPRSSSRGKIQGNALMDVGGRLDLDLDHAG